jgi:hypothetical protein
VIFLCFNQTVEIIVIVYQEQFTLESDKKSKEKNKA